MVKTHAYIHIDFEADSLLDRQPVSSIEMMVLHHSNDLPNDLDLDLHLDLNLNLDIDF